MTDTPPDPRIEQEFDVLMARAGLAIPPDRRPTLLAGFAELRGQLALLRGPRTAAAEPSNTFALRPWDIAP